MNIVILGGNGYIGRAVTEKWLKINPKAQFYIVSRTGKNLLKDSRVHDIEADCTSARTLLAAMPDQVGVIVDLVGGMQDPDSNILPAEATVAVASKLDIPKIGYVGGTLGSGDFVRSKEKAASIIRGSGRDVTIVKPTLVYGNGRSDSLAKMVPFMKFFGLFSKKFRPVDVNEVAESLIDGLQSRAK